MEPVVTTPRSKQPPPRTPLTTVARVDPTRVRRLILSVRRRALTTTNSWRDLAVDLVGVGRRQLTWGVRRFFIQTADGNVIAIARHADLHARLHP